MIGCQPKSSERTIASQAEVKDCSRNCVVTPVDLNMTDEQVTQMQLTHDDMCLLLLAKNHCPLSHDDKRYIEQDLRKRTTSDGCEGVNLYLSYIGYSFVLGIDPLGINPLMDDE
jgi:hypothetical protein